VVQFYQGKLMHVNYDPHLVRLVREVRQLTVLGYKIPLKIQEAADLAKKFMRQAKALEQVSYIPASTSQFLDFSHHPLFKKTKVEIDQECFC
jgi:dynein heavy chain 2